MILPATPIDAPANDSPAPAMTQVKDRTLQRIYLFFVIIFVVIAVVAGYALRSINRAQAASDWVNHTYATIYELENVLSASFAGEGSARTYAVTGDPQDLAASREAFAVMDDHLQTAEALVRDDAAATAQLQQVADRLAAREAFARRLWAARDAGDGAKVSELLRADDGSDVMGEVKRTLGKLRAVQYDRLGEQDHASYVQAQTTRWVVGLGIGLDLLLFGAVAWLIRDNLSARSRLQAALEAANADLETRVADRTHELAEANERLAAENLERQWTNQSLEHQLHYNQLIVNSVDDPVFVMTKAMHVTRINPAVSRFTGLGEKDILGRPIDGAMSLGAAEDATLGDLRAVLQQSLREGRDLLRREVQVTLKSGATAPATLNLFPLRDGNKVVGGVIILRLPQGPVSARA